MGLFHDIESPFKRTANICGKHSIDGHKLWNSINGQYWSPGCCSGTMSLLYSFAHGMGEFIIIAYEK